MERLRWAARRQIQPAPDSNGDPAHIRPDRERGSLERKQEVEVRQTTRLRRHVYMMLVKKKDLSRVNWTFHIHVNMLVTETELKHTQIIRLVFPHHENASIRPKRVETH